jgi:disulfide oxidoreductase YuzD
MASVPCVPAKFVLQRIATKLPIQAQVINVTSKSEYSQYMERVPVVLINDQVIGEGKIREASIRERIEMAIEADLPAPSRA